MQTYLCIVGVVVIWRIVKRLFRPSERGRYLERERRMEAERKFNEKPKSHQDFMIFLTIWFVLYSIFQLVALTIAEAFTEGECSLWLVLGIPFILTLSLSAAITYLCE